MDKFIAKMKVVFTTTDFYMRLFFAFTIIAFIYSLGFATDFVLMYDDNRAWYQNAQEVNHYLFDTSVIMVILAFIVLKSKIYKKPFASILNSVFFFGTVAATLFISTTSLLKTIEVGDGYKNANFTNVIRYDETFEELHFTYTVAYPIFIILMLATVATVVFAVLNAKKNNKEVDGHGY